MTSENSAQTAITLAALVTTGSFAIRKLTEPELAKEISPGLAHDYRSVFGKEPPVSWGQYLKSAGFLFISLAIIGAMSPEIGKGFAVLVGTGAFLGNFTAIQKDLITQKGAPSSSERYESLTPQPQPQPQPRRIK